MSNEKDLHEDLINDLIHKGQSIANMAQNIPLSGISRNLNSAAHAISNAVRTLRQVQRLGGMDLKRLQSKPLHDDTVVFTFDDEPDWHKKPE